MIIYLVGTINGMINWVHTNINFKFLYETAQDFYKILVSFSCHVCPRVLCLLDGMLFKGKVPEFPNSFFLWWTASVNLEYPYSLPGSKRPYVALVSPVLWRLGGHFWAVCILKCSWLPLQMQGDDPLYSDPRVRPRTHLESSFPVASPG